MDAILQQKRKGQAQFRIQIDEFLSNSIFTKQSQQLTPDVLQQLLSTQPTQGLFNTNTNKVSVQKLTQAIYDSGCQFTSKQFQKLFNNKKQLKPQQIYQLLKTYQLTQFNIQQQIVKHLCGQDDKLSIKKLDKMMKDLGYQKQLNKKDKEIMVQCFDYDKDGKVGRQDVRTMGERVEEIRKQKRQKLQMKKVVKITDNKLQ